MAIMEAMTARAAAANMTFRLAPRAAPAAMAPAHAMFSAME